MSQDGSQVLVYWFPQEGAMGLASIPDFGFQVLDAEEMRLVPDTRTGGQNSVSGIKTREFRAPGCRLLRLPTSQPKPFIAVDTAGCERVHRGGRA